MKGLINKSYETKRVFTDFELEVPNGEITCVLGASGVGKTTLLNILAGLTAFDGEIVGAPEKVGYVFQTPRLIPHLTVAGNLAYAGGEPEKIDRVLETLQLTEHKNKRPNQLSGGEKQRVNLARAFLSDSELLLLDEPFAALDTGLKIRLWREFAELWSEKKPTTVLVTHDLEEAWALGHTILLLQDGKAAYRVRPTRTAFPTPYGEQSAEKAAFLQAVLQEE
ncbi:MAG: ABC transporter ATP-binding protein [Clostridia bacterium]|nr:ABC transporter ATP-binding protein [Clostridia bacterium]